MTTFTSEDRENAYKEKIDVEPIPFAGWVNTAPPHVVDSGASVMEINNKPAAWFYQYPGETGIFMCADAEAMKGIEGKGYIITPLYTHPAKELTDVEISGNMST
jgi:hypothetical protein